MKMNNSKRMYLNVTADQPKETPHLYGRLITSYSEKRASEDTYNREKGLKRLDKKVNNNKLTKEAINYQKFDEDSIWDGLKGYVTNTDLSAKQIIESYGNLWQVEKAFRMSKTDLRFRPIFHRKETRIKAHLIICFAACALFKELEIKIKKNDIALSLQKEMEELKEIQELTYQLPKYKQIKSQLLQPNETQKMLLNIKI